MPGGVGHQSDVTAIAPESDHRFIFTPSQPGPIQVLSIPQPVPLPSQTETGRLGRIALFRPGDTTPVASMSALIGAQQLALNYAATAADLAKPGAWTCRISNDSLINITFSTTVDFPVAALFSASFDIMLLNDLLALVMSTADVRIHLQSSRDDSAQSIVSWSIPVAQFLPDIPANKSTGAPERNLTNTVELRFHQDTFSDSFLKIPLNFSLNNLNSLFSPSLSLNSVTSQLVTTIAFDVEHALLQGFLGSPDIRLQLFQISLLIGLNGDIEADCQVVASTTIAGNFYDASDKIRTKVLENVNAQLAKLGATQATVKKFLDSFFVRLLRLNETVQRPFQPPIQEFAQIQSYQVNNSQLNVTYVLVPQDPQKTT